MVRKPIKKGDGKTKTVIPEVGNPGYALMTAKDIVSWKNKFQQVMVGKAVWSTTTTANMFRVLAHKGILNAFVEEVAPDTLRVLNCNMVKIEAVCRFKIEEVSSARLRNPGLPLGPLAKPMVEFFLKTDGLEFDGITVPDNDPFISSWDDTGVWVHAANQEVSGPGTFIPAEKLLVGAPTGSTLKRLFRTMAEELVKAGVALKAAWAGDGWDLGDFKVEFGWTVFGQLVIADVIDNDSWRLKDDQGVERSKQTIRDGKPIPEAANDFELVARKSDEVWQRVREAA